MFDYLLWYFIIEGAKLFDEIAILMLNIGHSVGELLLIVEKTLYWYFTLIGLNKVLSVNAIGKSIGSQRNGMFLIFKTLCEVFGWGPSFVDIIAFEDIGDDARYIFGDVFFVEPERIECQLVPTDAVDIVG